MEETMVEYINDIIIPFVESKRELLSDPDACGLVIMDNFKGQTTPKVNQLLEENSIHVCLLPPNSTDRLVFRSKHVYWTLAPVKSLEVKLGDGHVLMAVGQGTLQLSMKCGRDKYRKFTLSDVLYVPKLSCNFLSEKGNDVKFYEDTCVYSRC